MSHNLVKITNAFIAIVFVVTALFSPVFHVQAASDMPDMMQETGEMQEMCGIDCPSAASASDCIEHCLNNFDAGETTPFIVQQQPAPDFVIATPYPITTFPLTNFSSTIPPPTITANSTTDILLKTQKRE